MAEAEYVEVKGNPRLVELNIAVRWEIVELIKAWIEMSRYDISVEAVISAYAEEAIKSEFEKIKPKYLPDGPSIARKYGVMIGPYADC